MTRARFDMIVGLEETPIMLTIKDLEAFGDGWNRHDVDYLDRGVSEWIFAGTTVDGGNA